MDYRDCLKKQLDEILRKQEEITINKNLAKVCKELNGFTNNIQDCLAKEQDLPQQDKDRIQQLNDEYNENIGKYKKLKGL